jgi:hypothetical protein
LTVAGLAALVLAAFVFGVATDFFLAVAAATIGAGFLAAGAFFPAAAGFATAVTLVLETGLTVVLLVLVGVVLVAAVTVDLATGVALGVVAFAFAVGDLVAVALATIAFVAVVFLATEAFFGVAGFFDMLVSYRNLTKRLGEIAHAHRNIRTRIITQIAL